MLKGEENWILEGTQTVSDRSAYIKAFTHTHKKSSGGIRKNRKEGVLPMSIILPSSLMWLLQRNSLQSILENI